MDAGTFKNLASDYAKVAERTTLYISSRDKALASSEIIHDYPRAGFYPPITVLDKIDTVACTDVDVSFMGHGYYAAARDLLQDIHNLITDNNPPDDRFGLKPRRNDDDDEYWVFEK